MYHSYHLNNAWLRFLLNRLLLHIIISTELHAKAWSQLASSMCTGYEKSTNKNCLKGFKENDTANTKISASDNCFYTEASFSLHFIPLKNRIKYNLYYAILKLFIVEKNKTRKEPERILLNKHLLVLHDARATTI